MIQARFNEGCKAGRERIGSEGKKSDRKDIEEADTTGLAADTVDGAGRKVGVLNDWLECHLPYSWRAGS